MTAPENSLKLPDDWKPCRYEEISTVLNSLGIEISYIEKNLNDISTNIVSYSFRALRGEYCVYLNKKMGDHCKLVCDLREKGHILYNHFLLPNTQMRLFDSFFKKNISLIFLRLPEEKNTAQRLGYYSKYIFDRFSGIAKSMEINSKLFKDDWDTAKNLLMENDCVIRNDTALCYPKPGWPLGLDWTSYMVFLCRDMKSSLDDIGSGEGKKIKTGDITSYNAEKKTQDNLKELYQSCKTIIENKENPFDNDIKVGRTSHITGAASSYSVSECSDTKELLTILRERSIIEKKKRIKTDIVYNINRNKFDNQTLVPRRLKIADSRPAALFILLDVSGSIPVNFLKSVVRTIVGAEGVFNKKKSRLICWSDSLCSDRSLDDLIEITAGGSTILSHGIEYCKKYFDDDSAFFIISDFQDDLYSWLEAAKDIKIRKTAIALANINKNMSFAHWFSMAGSNLKYNAEQVKPADFAKIFETVLLRYAS
ncbi:hypothetical protein AGMMS50212_04500 [Spirochaetia bacterium]|nr:hypothetical protein AGMMS50212_04500 [Spirochaetia bacterium]